MAVDKGLALRLANADAAVARASVEGNALVGGGVADAGSKLRGRKVLVDPEAAAAVVKALAGAGAQVPPGGGVAAGSVALGPNDGAPFDDPNPSKPKNKSAPGVAIQARLLEAASLAAKKRAAAAAESSGDGSKRRLLNAFVSALTEGSSSGVAPPPGAGIGSFDDPLDDDPLGVDAMGDDGAGSLFRGAPSAGIPQTTPVMAELKPGDVCPRATQSRIKFVDESEKPPREPSQQPPTADAGRAPAPGAQPRGRSPGPAGGRGSGDQDKDGCDPSRHRRAR